MKAAICTKYGDPDVIELQDIPSPIPKNDEVRVRVKATCVNSGDSRIRALRVPAGMKTLVRLAFGFRSPRQPVLGTDFAGIVDSIGSDVTNFRAGDEVYGALGTKTGSHAEFVTVAETSAILPKPGGLSMADSASLVFGGQTALYFLKKKANVKSGEHVLINGATGAVGAAAIQVAKSLGAVTTAVCSADNASLATSLGADHVIDYRQTDFAEAGGSYDVIMDNVGNAGWSRSKHLLKPQGRLLLIVASLPQMLAALLRPKRSDRSIMIGVAADGAESLRDLTVMVERQQLQPVIDEVLPFEQIVRAHEIADSGRKRGSVVLTL
jgi:NADPH:quinone reductase-like Zn-dependent oxidoreductase